jgi:hypothetical protein
MEYVFWLALAFVSAPFVVEGLFWCFCWCFCKVDEYFRERYMRIILENMERLEEIAAEAEKKAA